MSFWGTVQATQRRRRRVSSCTAIAAQEGWVKGSAAGPIDEAMKQFIARCGGKRTCCPGPTCGFGSRTGTCNGHGIWTYVPLVG